MLTKLILATATGLFMASAAVAQTSAPPNVNPGSMNSGAEASGAGNQPRSPGMNSHGTHSDQRDNARRNAPAAQTDGINANVKPGSTRSGHSESGPAAGSSR